MARAPIEKYIEYLRSSAELLVERAMSYHSFPLHEDDVRRLLGSSAGYMELEYPVNVVWRNPTITTVVNRESVRLGIGATGRKPTRDRSGVCPDPTEAVNNWIIQRYNHAKQKGLTNALIHTLCNQCSTLEQLRYVWPTMLLLCDRGPLKEIAPRLQEFRPLRNAPKLPPALRGAMRECTAFLTAYSMLEEVNPWPGSLYLFVRGSFIFSAHGLTYSAS